MTEAEEERAAIMEYDAGLCRACAEWEAQYETPRPFAECGCDHAD